ncbi:MAG: ABC transporter ATP-binding protein [Planctomycetota bacterium]
MSDAAIKIEGLVRRRGADWSLEVEALEFPRGGIHVLVGSNGAGKTTLLRILALLDQPDGGTIEILGSDARRLDARAGGELRRRLAFATQRPYLFDSTVVKNVKYPLAARGVPRAERGKPARSAMERLGVAHLAERRARTLSAGEGARVALARAIASGPEVLLLDEPLANLDPGAAPVVEALLVELAASGVTVVAATHVLEQAYRLSADVVRLEAGRLAPPAVENLLEGEVVDSGAGAELVLAGDVRVSVVTESRGRVRAAIAPGDIVLSAGRLDSSARNALEGRVTALRERGGAVLMTADAGVPLTASVTHESCEHLGLTVGSRVVMTFKATAVEVF